MRNIKSSSFSPHQHLTDNLSISPITTNILYSQQKMSLKRFLIFSQSASAPTKSSLILIKNIKSISSSPHQPYFHHQLSPTSCSCKNNISVLSTSPYENLLTPHQHRHSSLSKLKHMLHCLQQTSWRLPPKSLHIKRPLLYAAIASFMLSYVVCTKNGVGGGNNQRGGT